MVTTKLNEMILETDIEFSILNTILNDMLMHPQEGFESEFCDRLSTLLSQHVVVSANLQKVVDSHVDRMCGCNVGFRGTETSSGY